MNQTDRTAAALQPSRKRRWQKMLAAAVVLLGIVPLLAGCWDRTEINDVAFVLSTALDKEDDGSYRVSVQIPLPGQLGGPSGGGGGTSGDKTYYIDSEVGKTIQEASSNLQKRMSRQLFYAHRRTIIIGEELAREGINGIFDPMPRLPESRLTTYAIIAKGKGYDLLNARPKLERFSGEAIRELAQSPFVLPIDMKDVAIDLSSESTDPAIIYMGVKKSEKGKPPANEIEVLGYAIFKYDKLVAITEDSTSSGLTWLRNQVKTRTLTIDLGGGKLVTVSLRGSSCKVIPKVEGKNAHFQIIAKANAVVVDNQFFYDFSKVANIHKAERVLSASIKKDIEHILAVMQENKSDAAGLGLNLFRSYPKEWRRYFEADWRDHMAEAEYDIQVSTSLENVGLIFQNVVKGERQ